MSRPVWVAAIAAAALAAVAPANAEVLAFRATPSGDQEVPDPVTTDANGVASILVDTASEQISIDLDVTGLTTDDLFDTLVAEPIGPIHLHNAPAGQNGPVVIPFAFGASYQDTADGFSLTVNNFNFDDAVALSGSMLSFDDFVSGLLAGDYYVNIHTDGFPAGELRGQVAAVPLPGAIAFFAAGLAGLGVARRKGRAS